MPLPDNPIIEPARCDFCGVNCTQEKCNCHTLSPFAKDLATFLQQEIHKEHLPGFYFTPSQVYVILEQFYGKDIEELACIGL